jgi:hypothetical protein
MENGKRVGGTRVGVPFLLWGENEEKISTQRTQRGHGGHRADRREEDYAEYAEDAECAEERKTRTLKTAGCGTHVLILYFLYLLYFNFYWYSWSMWRIAPFSSKATSKALDFLTRMSANCFSWVRSTAWSLTISRTAKNATIMAWREGQASKN